MVTSGNSATSVEKTTYTEENHHGGGYHYISREGRKNGLSQGNLIRGLATD